MPNTWKVVLLALALLVVDGSLYYRYNRLFAQSPDSLTSAFLEPAEREHEWQRRRRGAEEPPRTVSERRCA